MIKKTFFGEGNSKQLAALMAIQEFDRYIRTFNNVQFVEAYNISGNAYRYIYKIDGCENLHYCIENSTSASNANISMTLRKTDQLYTSSYLRSLGSGGETESFIAFDAYIIAYNGRLKGIWTTRVGSFYPYPCYFIEKNGERYCYTTTNSPSNPQQVYRDSDTAELYLDRNYWKYSINEKALFRKAIIAVGYSGSNVIYIEQADDIWIIENENFANMANMLIDIDGVRYRQWGTNYVFVLDGDVE